MCKTWAYQQQMICSHILLYFASTLLCNLLRILVIMRNIFGSIDWCDRKLADRPLPVNSNFQSVRLFCFVLLLILLFIVAKPKVNVLRDHYLLAHCASPFSPWSLWDHKLWLHVLPFHTWHTISLLIIFYYNTSLTLKLSDRYWKIFLKSWEYTFLSLRIPIF